MRDSAGVTELVERMKALRPAVIVLEATGGFEQVVAAALAAAGLPVAGSTRARSATSPASATGWPRPIASTLR
jgi:hypothetical protein